MKQNYSEKKKREFTTRLKVGDPVMALAGGNSVSNKKVKGEVGKILRFLPKTNRVVVEGVNMIKRRKRATSNQEAAGVITKEGSLHLSNVQYYSEKHQRPFRIQSKILDDGRKVRGFLDPKTKEFEQIDA